MNPVTSNFKSGGGVLKPIEADYFTCKKTRCTFVLAILIIMHHSSSVNNYAITTGLGEFALFISQYFLGFAQVAVPLFFIISGVLFYRNYSYGKTKEKYRSRLKTLVIPYLIWNTVDTLFQFACSYSFVSNYFIGRTKAVFNLSNVAQGIFLHKYSVLWFLFNLIIFVLAAPLIYTVIKNKKVGAVGIIILIVLYGFGIGIPESVFTRSDSLIFYMIGAYIGCHYFQTFKRKMANKPLSVVCLIFCILIALIYTRLNVAANHYAYNNTGKMIYLFSLIIFCFAVWNAFDLLQNNRYYAFERESFAIYVIHCNLIGVVAKLIYLIMPKSDCFAIVNYVFTILLSVAIIIMCVSVIDRISHRLKTVLFGR